MKTRLFLLLFGLAAAWSATAHPSVSVVVDAAGNAYYSDLAQVWKVAPDGTKTVAVGGVHTHELYLDAQGNLYGEHLWYEGEKVDKWGHYVWRRSPDGKVAKIIPNREGFLTDYSFVRDAGGNMYLANREKQRVERLAPDGTRTVVATGLAKIRWMAVRPDGTLYVIDGADLVRVPPARPATRVARDLAKAYLFRIYVGTQHAVMGLWPDSAGNVYIAAYSEGKVKRVSPDGRVTVVLESEGSWGPTGGAFAPNGDLLVLESSFTNRVRLRRVRLRK